MPFIAAFDIATATGICDGEVGAAPRVFTWYMSDVDGGRAVRLCYFRRLCDRYFETQKVDAVYYEAPLNVGVMKKIGAADGTVALLRGAIGVLESCAVHAGITTVEAINLQDARQALTGHRTFRRNKSKDAAKIAMMNAAKTMKVDVQTDHEADAYAVWFYACGKLNPRLALLASPLFSRGNKWSAQRKR